MHIKAEVLGLNYEFNFPLGQLEPARSADMAVVLQGQFSKTGNASFRLESLEALDFPPLLIPAATFKELRLKFYDYLQGEVATRFQDQVAAARQAALQDVATRRASGRGRTRGNEREALAVIMDLPKDWRYPIQQGADCTILPLSKAAIHQLAAVVSRMRGSEERIIWQLPFIIFDRDMPLYRDTVRQLYRIGFRRFEAANLSHFHLLRPFQEVRISAWHRCFSLNSQALAAWQELGAELATLYIEDDAVNLAELLAAEVDIERRVIVYAPLPVMTTKIRFKDVHSNIPLHSDRGEAYSVSTRDGLQTITAALPFSLTARHAELRQKGCSSFVIDLRQSPRDAWNDILAAHKNGRDIPGTTEFNYAKELV